MIKVSIYDFKILNKKIQYTFNNSITFYISDTHKKEEKHNI